MGCAAEARETAAGQDKRKLFRDEARCLEALLALSDAKSGTVWRSAARCLAELCSFGNAPPPQRHHPRTPLSACSTASPRISGYRDER
jgi:hypothetical protein